MFGPVTQLSPGVATREVDLTNFIPNVGMSGGAFVGQFVWGPVLTYTLISNSNDLAFVFGKPTEKNYVDWYCASNFLSYTSNLNVIRVVNDSDDTALNATAHSDVATSGILIRNEDHFQTVMTVPSITGEFAARYPGLIGNSLKVSLADSSTFDTWSYKWQFDFKPGTSEHCLALNSKNDELHVVIVDEDGLFTGVPGAVLEKFSFLSKASDAKQLDGAPAFYGNVINEQSKYVYWLSTPTLTDTTDANAMGDLAPSREIEDVVITNGGSGYTDETTNVIFSDPVVGGVRATGTAVIDAGVITGIMMTSNGSGYATTPTVTITSTVVDPLDGSIDPGPGTGAAATCTLTDASISSEWAIPALSGAGVPRTYASLYRNYEKSLNGGSDGGEITSDELVEGWDLFKNSEEVDVSLLFVGDAGGAEGSRVVTKYVIENVAERRKDCVVFCSPDLNDVLNQPKETVAQTVVDARNQFNSSSYAVMDSGWKLQYDVYNDKFRWIPLNADLAGLCAMTDRDYDPWWSPAGFNRGHIKNCVSLAFNPDQSQRDDLYKNNVNPVVTFRGDGTILYGDKTLQAKASAFQWINVRRLFIVLRKAISNAAKYQLFEFNDQFTRAQFRNMVEPYLREVRGRRGIYDFKVICDETNNTPEIIDRAEFVANIFIKPARSINFITLNFVAVRTGVEFSEIVGSLN